MSKIDKLEQLDRLKASGALTDQEFIAAKAKLLESREIPVTLIIGAALLVVISAGLGTWLYARPPSNDQPSSQATQNPNPSILPSADQASPVNVALDATTVPHSRIDRLFIPSLVHGNLPFFEAISGPAKQVFGSSRSYEIDGCAIWLEMKGQEIQSITTSISNQCNPSSLGFTLNGKTLAQAAQRFGEGRYSASCLRSCGNAVEPSYTLEIDGYHANNWISYSFDSQPNGDRDYDRLNVWESKMEAAEGEDYVIMSRFNCDQRYGADARRAIQGFKIKSVTISNGLDPEGSAACS
ncbi:SHOCT domain-containing protein [uncultured Brevundimonas sp.]|uniref:SHOCT domain-containing protein n=1 Tax=uncultured Brevundimonas sp. TaxID=213418 RepID=UPI0030EF5359|tara:strand:- start:154131 stop:155018 length:888 start_codon:yes stop_codon:yes gene_type:complete